MKPRPLAQHTDLDGGVTVIERAGLARQVSERQVSERPLDGRGVTRGDEGAVLRPVDAHRFAARHFSFLRRRLPFVQVNVADDGAVAMTAFGAPLVRLAAPVTTTSATEPEGDAGATLDADAGEMEVAYRNLKTWLYRDAGDIAFITSFDADAISLTVTLRNVRPRYWTWLYRQTHLRIHNLLTRWFVRTFVHEIAPSENETLR